MGYVAHQDASRSDPPLFLYPPSHPAPLKTCQTCYRRITGVESSSLAQRLRLVGYLRRRPRRGGGQLLRQVKGRVARAVGRVPVGQLAGQRMELVVSLLPIGGAGTGLRSRGGGRNKAATVSATTARPTPMPIPACARFGNWLHGVVGCQCTEGKGCLEEKKKRKGWAKKKPYKDFETVSRLVLPASMDPKLSAGPVDAPSVTWYHTLLLMLGRNEKERKRETTNLHLLFWFVKSTERREQLDEPSSRPIPGRKSCKFPARGNTR